MKLHSLSTHRYADGEGGGGGCLSPQNTSGVSEVNFLSAESDAIEVTGD